MAGDAFIQIDQIAGEAEDKDYAGAIEVDGWQWGLKRDSAPPTQGERRGATQVRHFTFSHAIDAASPQLMHRCATGAPVAKAVLTMRRAGGAALRYLEATFNNVVIIEVSTGLPAGAETAIESVSFAFESVIYDYTPQSRKGQERGGKLSFSWHTRSVG